MKRVLIMVVDNRLIYIKHSMCLLSLKCFYSILSLTCCDDKFYVNIIDILNKNGINNPNNYRLIRLSCQELKDVSITIEENNSLQVFNMFNIVEYDNELSSVVVEFSKEYKELFKEIGKEGYTHVMLSKILKLKTPYQIKLYIYLKSNMYKKKDIKIDLKKLRNLLGIDDNTYKLYKHFNDRVLKPCQKAFKLHSDISFSYENIKYGRKTKDIKFRISKSFAVLDIKKDIDNVKDIELAAIKIVEKHLIKRSQLKVLKQYSSDYIMFYYEYCIKLKDSGRYIKSFNGFFYNTLITDPSDFNSIQLGLKEKTKKKDKLLSDKLKEEVLYNESVELFEKLKDDKKEEYINQIDNKVKFVDNKKLATLLFHEQRVKELN